MDLLGDTHRLFLCSSQAQQAAMAEAHYNEVSSLGAQLAELDAVRSAALASHHHEMAAMMLELEATRAKLAAVEVRFWVNVL